MTLQMLSPYSKGLFRRAISQCGVALSPWAIQLDPMATTKKVGWCRASRTLVVLVLVVVVRGGLRC
jgi:hypothetical protein